MAGDDVRVKSESKKNLIQLLELLDEKSRNILWYLWWYRHAHLSQLRNLINASSDSEVLLRLRSTINEKAQKLWGKPAVNFKQHKIDPLTGENVLFNWWFLEDEEIELLAYNCKPLVDVLEEKHGFTIMVRLPSLEDFFLPTVEFRNGVLKVKLRRKDTKGPPKDLVL